MQLLDEKGVLLLLLGGRHQRLLSSSQLLPSLLSLLVASLGETRLSQENVELVLNALSIIGSIYIPQNMVCTYIFKLLECAKVSVWNLRDLHLQSI